MKKTLAFILLLASASFLMTCTDDDLNHQDLPAHCSDGLLNHGELDVDCGGECASCGSLEPPCSPDTNKIILDSSLITPFPNGTFTFYAAYGNAYTNYYEVVANSANWDIYIKWHGGAPTQQRVYLLGGIDYLNGFYSEGQANIRMNHITGNKALSSSGKLYVKPLPDDKLLITFCDARFVLETNTQMVVYNGISGRFLGQ